MTPTNPFAGYKIYECILLEGKFSGYVLTTANQRDFTKVAKACCKEKDGYDPVKVSAILRKAGYEAQELKIGILNFSGDSQVADKKFQPGIVLGKYRAFEIYVEKMPGQEVWENFRGILATDCPVPRLRELIGQYAKAHKSRERADIQSYLQAEGHFASFQSVHWVMTYGPSANP